MYIKKTIALPMENVKGITMTVQQLLNRKAIEMNHTWSS